MIDGIDAFYQQIADSIQEAIPEEWSSAKFEAIFHAEGSSYSGEYIRSIDGKLRSFGTTSQGERTFRELRKKFKESGMPLWGQACFEIESSGDFQMKWGYDNLDENGDTRFDADEERRRQEESRLRFESQW